MSYTHLVARPAVRRLVDDARASRREPPRKRLDVRMMCVCVCYIDITFVFYRESPLANALIFVSNIIDR